MDKENLKSTILSAGWQDVLEFFNKELLEEKKIAKVDINKRYEDIAIETIARCKAARMVNQALAKIEKSVKDLNVKKESYK